MLDMKQQEWVRATRGGGAAACERGGARGIRRVWRASRGRAARACLRPRPRLAARARRAAAPAAGRARTLRAPPASPQRSTLAAGTHLIPAR